MTFKELLEKAEEEFEPHNEIESDYDTDRDAIPPYKVRRHPNMDVIYEKLTFTLDNATHPMDTQTRDAVRIALVKAFRAARARGRHDGMREARKREWMTHPDSDFVQVAKRGKYKKHLGHFRGNPMLHKREREQLCELHGISLATALLIRNAMD
ncbi:uncharacterized protein B0H18DRAFT_960641 [Fomitopsis serialis]|uniref:uncharacterized protein n=1 Tax=Fomitopsis serialis TaxID=139415 RepID=UPI0020088592|nr:uncharacterized protein B0H18DRAFT_960641 [Neoantrodia serialis]KAH9913030.1 hypothetical protein B0H18DRAFT_960641 [Neoantrodia serialis]